MQRIILAAKVFFATVFFMGFPFKEARADDILTGDTRLACEAILCLSSPARPGECAPSLDRYFGINKKKWSDTVKARQNFLNKCPSSTESDVMLSLSRAITYGAGQCGAAQLNARGQWVVKESKLDASACRNRTNINKGNYQESWRLERVGDDSGDSYCVHTVRYWVVDPNPPGYCLELWNHQNTYFDAVQFVRGQNPWEGRWIEK